MAAGLLLVALLLAPPAPTPAPSTAAAAIDFEPKVGTTGTRVLVRGPIATGAVVRFGGRAVAVLAEPGGDVSFMVPVGSDSAFVEIAVRGKVVARSAVPFVVAGPSMVSVPRLIGLKEAIDVFGYVDDTPEGLGAPEPRSRSILKLDDAEILTIGPVAPMPGFLGPAVSLGDAASAARTGMGSAGLILTARPPTRKTPPPSSPP